VLALRSSRDYAALETTTSALQAAHGELDRYARDLVSRVSERTAELEAANRKLAHLAEIDGLTLVGNRRHFDEALRSAWNDHARRRAPLSMILVDVDAFKAFNDRHGHLAGDDTLRRISAILARTARRPGDDVTRYGGEEFAAILPNTDADGARHVAEEVRTAVETAAIPHRTSPVARVVTASVGVATVVPEDGSEPSSLVDRADRALYRAKQGGRNRVESDA
jgi:diguanylate cyclase (GGDEF)-like protein